MHREEYMNMPALQAQNRLFARTFKWMFAGLLVTALFAWFTYSSGLYIRFLYDNTFFVLIIAEVVMVLLFSFLFRRLSPMAVSILFFAYAIVNGITMSVIFAVYEMSSIVVLFLAAAALFGGFALYGYNYKGDLTRWGPLLLISLLIAIVMSVINILFLKAQMFEIFIDCFVLFLFFGLTVYDMNKIKRMSMTADGSGKLHVYAAMELYLDFINIFLRLLSLFGKSKN